MMGLSIKSGMAKDQEIQTEINIINQEFIMTEMDGIGEI